MKKAILFLVFLGSLAGTASAGFVLGTTYPPGTPLSMSAGTTSGPMLVNISSNNPSQDIMAAWNILLMITPESGATGTLTFASPATGTPPNPPNYIFGTNGLGIAVTNTGAQLSANDFFDPSNGPGASAALANLLQMEFQATPNASGLFGVYAVEGVASTQWTDSNFNTQLFSNVPDGSGLVQIGEVIIAPSSVPEPTSLELLGLGVIALTGARCYWRRVRVYRLQGTTKST